MPATRPHRLKNPLRQLRLILGDGQTPLGQEEFASRAGLSVATVRAIEAGVRPLDGVLDQIAVVLKAQWVREPVAQWYVVGATNRYEAHYADPGYFDPGDPYSSDYAAHKLAERVLDIFGAANPEQRTALVIHLSKYLKETAQSFGIDKDLSTSEPRWQMTTKPFIWGKRLKKDVVIWPQYEEQPGKWCLIPPQTDTGGIFDFRSRRTFNPADYPARTATEVARLAQAETHATETTPPESRNFKRTMSALKQKPKRKTTKNRILKKLASQV
jgi:transcriptional regulator with XRE-family HTH domain